MSDMGTQKTNMRLVETFWPLGVVNSVFSNIPLRRTCTSSLPQSWLLELRSFSVTFLGCKHQFLDLIVTVYLTKSCSQEVFQMRPVPAEHIFIPMAFGIVLLRYVGLPLTRMHVLTVLSPALTKRESSLSGNIPKASLPSSHGNLYLGGFGLIFHLHLLSSFICFQRRLPDTCLVEHSYSDT